MKEDYLKTWNTRANVLHKMILIEPCLLRCRRFVETSDLNLIMYF